MDQLQKKNEKEVPPLEEFQMIPQFLQSLSAQPNGSSISPIIIETLLETPLFVKELRDLISGVLRSPPHRLDDKYREISFEIVNELFHVSIGFIFIGNIYSL